MAAYTIEKLQAEERKNVGRGASRDLRRQGKMPAVVYGKGGEPLHLALDAHEFLKLRRVVGFRARQLDLVVGKETVRVLPRDIQVHPVTDKPEHVDFLRVDEKTRLNVLVPVKFINQEKSPGIKRGGVLNIVRRRLELNCLVSAIPEKIVIDLEGTEIGESIHISKIKLPEGVRPTITDRDFTVAAIVGRKAEKEEDTTTPVTTVIGEEGEEGAEGAAAGAADAKAADKGGKKE